MPTRRLPNSTPAILRQFAAAADTYRNTPKPADRILDADTWAKLDDSDPASLHSRFKKEATEVELAQAALAPLTNAQSQAAARLTVVCSHFHQVLDLGIARGAFAPGARSYYARDVHARTLPPLSSYQEILTAGRAIVAGEADRRTAEAGAYLAMALPSAAEVQAALDTFTNFKDPAQQSQAQVDQEREDVQVLYPEAQALAVDICESAEFFFRKDPDASSRRAKCRRWGVVYLYGDAEPTDPGDTTRVILDPPPAVPPPPANP
jgi:hypothetical protein